MTILKSSQHLLGQIREVLGSTDGMKDMKLVCSDGTLSCSSLLVAAISPMLHSLGSEPNEGLFVVYLPDFSVNQLTRFISQLTSEKEPQKNLNSFLDILNCLGYLSPLNQFVSDLKSGDLEEALEPEPLSYSLEESDTEEVSKENRKTKQRRKDKGTMKALIQKCFVQEKNIFVCSICGTERNGGRSIQQHLLWHQRHPNEDYLTCNICKQCGKVCTDYNAMKFHVRQVHCDRTLACTYEGCGKVFKTQVALKSHHDIHAGIKNYVCAECGFAFRSKQEMKGHVLRKHSKVKKSIPCELCGKIFRHMSNLKSHLNIHKAQSERQHRCTECNVTFKSEVSLKNHMILHDPSRPFKCSKCPLRYKNRDALCSHESSHDHTQYSCELCDVSYTRKDNLKRHIKDKHKQSLK